MTYCLTALVEAPPPCFFRRYDTLLQIGAADLLLNAAIYCEFCKIAMISKQIGNVYLNMKQNCIVPLEGQGERIDRFLAQAFSNLSRTEARRQLSAGSVFLNGKIVRVQSRKLWKGDRITWIPKEKSEPTTRPELEATEAVPTKEPSFKAESLESPAKTQPYDEAETDKVGGGQPPRRSRNGRAEQRARAAHAKESIDWSVYGGEPILLFRDRHLAIINKPSGIPVEPTHREDLTTCLRQVEALLRSEGVHPKKQYATAAHRLDKGASGAVAFATSKSAARDLGSQFANRTASRLYNAILCGRLEKDEGQLVDYLAQTGPGIRQGTVKEGEGKKAILNYKVLKRFSCATLVEIRLKTGRTHQIRVQFSEIGHPLIGDWLYCPAETAATCPEENRMMLHALELTIIHPHSKEEILSKAPIPPRFLSYFEKLDKLSLD